MTHPKPKHRGDRPYATPLAELGHMVIDHDVSARWSMIRHSVDTPHYVVTSHERREDTGEVLMVLSPAAADVLAQIIARFSATHPATGVGMEDYDPNLWHHVTIDLQRNKALVGPRPDAATARLYGGPRATTLEVVR